MESEIRHAQDERGLWLARALAALYLALIVHVSLVPAEFGVGPRQFARHLVRMVLVLDPRELSEVSLHGLVDIAANVVLYAPLGLLWAWTRRRPRWRGAAIGVPVSLALEILQAATWDRTASLLDVVTNGIGHAAGFAVALWLIRERGVSHALFVGGKRSDALAHLAGTLRSCYLVALLVLSLFPYDVTVSATRIWSKALGDGSEPGRILLFLVTPWDPSRLAGVVLALLLAAVFGCLSWLAASRDARPGVGTLALQGLVVSGLIEAGQVVVASRTSDVAQVLAGGVGAVLGAWLARPWAGVAAQPGTRPRADPVRGALLAGTALWIAVVWTEAWLPYELVSSWEQAARKLVFGSHWLPFSAHAIPGTLAEWQDMGRELGLYVPLGLLVGAWADRSPSPLRWRWRRLAPGAAIAALGCALELSQCVISGRTVDVGDAAVHALGGVVGLALVRLLSPRRPGGATPAS